MYGLTTVIPFFNYKQVAKKYLDVAVKTVLNWSDTDPEVIIVFDKTEENTGEEDVDKWQGHPNVRIIKRPRPPRGLQVARILGLREATKEYACVFDADDSSFKNFKKLQIEAMEREKAEVCFGCWQDYDSRLVNTEWDESRDHIMPNDIVYEAVKYACDNHRYSGRLFPYGNVLLCASWIIKRKTLLDTGMLDDARMPETGEGIMHMELDFTYNLVLKTQKAIIHTDQMYLYRTKYKDYYGDENIKWEKT